VDEIVSEIRRSVEEALETGLGSIEAAERAARAVGRRAAGLALQGIAGRWGTGHVGRTHTDGEGVVREFHQHRERVVQTLAGRLRLRRAYYLDRHGDSGGFFPLDRKIGLGKGGMSPALEIALGEVGAWVPFERVPALVDKLAGLPISEQTARRTTERLGAELLAEDERDAERIRQSAKAIKPEARPRRVAVSVDGAMGHVGGDWREAKIGAIYEFDEQGDQVRSSKRYVGRFGSPESLRPALTVEAMRAGVYEAETAAFLGDGAPWIWNLADEVLPQATHVLDFYHAMEHVSAVALARFGRKKEASRAWVTMARRRLLG